MTFVTVTKFSRTLVALLIHCCSARPCSVQQAFPSPIKVVYAFYRDKYKPTSSARHRSSLSPAHITGGSNITLLILKRPSIFDSFLTEVAVHIRYSSNVFKGEQHVTVPHSEGYQGTPALLSYVNQVG
ncbi:hypothetical protein PISMIDRAFT_679570 [Pisolithus microcarpus 441]|uniref:Secreted protein n=1 Tax=Pisolithus microcarpus 441 TaxID=765257 RepID=A0A0C9ZUE2_9AGAM|nr:hypothetical protein BKA83DRAFT_687292 [Pisolithus microcarpus]KIK15381.1 hypothetical protein PISMIDRAFT_687292 [Pisolithus microcarpus 441]KIK23293.1 hypothetical protein PISMIDRAFT_679570 [Pisolithus microcarpus 441]